MGDKTNEKGPPEFRMNPYIFTALLFGFGVWCLYDGWFTSNPGMQEHLLFNRVLSFVLIMWSVYDFFKVKKAYKNNDSEGYTDKDSELIQK
jgi:hypothetical protein